MHFQFKDCPEPIEGRKACFKLIARECQQLRLVPNDVLAYLTKLGPDRNNVRRTALTQLPPEASEHQCDLESDSPLPPTPHYNATLLREQGAMERHLHDLYAAMHECPAMVDAVILCKIWVKQRGLDQVGNS